MRKLIGIGIGLGLFLAPLAARAGDAPRWSYELVRLKVNDALPIGGVRSVSLGNQQVAIVEQGAKGAKVVARAPGKTSVLVFREDGTREKLRVEVR